MEPLRSISVFGLARAMDHLIAMANECEKNSAERLMLIRLGELIEKDVAEIRAARETIGAIT